MNPVTAIELTGRGDLDPTLDFKLTLRGGGRVVGKLPRKYGLLVWDWALEVTGAGGMVDLTDLLPDTTWAVYIPPPDG